MKENAFFARIKSKLIFKDITLVSRVIENYQIKNIAVIFHKNIIFKKTFSLFVKKKRIAFAWGSFQNFQFVHFGCAFPI